jgi:hypothetical protein
MSSFTSFVELSIAESTISGSEDLLGWVSLLGGLFH